MSKREILACDRHEATIPAVGSFELNNSQNQNSLAKADLCQACLDEAISFLTPSKAKLSQKELKKAIADAGTAIERAVARGRKTELENKNPRHPNYWLNIEAKVMDIMEDLREQVHIDDVAKRMGDVSHGSTYSALHRLGSKGPNGPTRRPGGWRRCTLAR